ncbi:MAG: flagellin, partial [Comamonas sp.]
VSYGSSTSVSLTAANVTDFDKALSGLSITVGGTTTQLSDLKKASTGEERLGQMVAAINEKTADTGVTAFLQEGATKGTYSIALKSDAEGVVSLGGFDSLYGAAGVTKQVPAVTPVTSGTSALSWTATTAAQATYSGTPGITDTATNAQAVVTALNTQLQAAEGYSSTGEHTGAAATLSGHIQTLNAAATAGTFVAADFNTAYTAFAAGQAAIVTADKADIDARLTAEAQVAAETALTAAASGAQSLNKDSTIAQFNDARTAINTARTAGGLGALTTAALVPANFTNSTAKDISAAVEAAAKSLQAELDPLGLTVSGTEVQDHKGIASVDISTQAGAWEAMKQIDSAIDQVNAARADLGALQTRFEKSIENIDIQNENISAARGRIVDADFAKETANLSRAQILQQAGTAMVAQANQLPQQVLSLLR